MPRSFESGTRPLNDGHHRYESANLNEPEFNPNFRPRKHGVSPWIKFGVPLLIVIIVGAVVGGIVGSRHSSSAAAASSSSGGSSSPENSASAAAQASAVKNVGVFFTATDAFGLPVYPQTTNSAAYGKPTFNPSAAAVWPSDPASFASPTVTTVRTDRPRLIAPKYKWDALPALIQTDAYLKAWNTSIFGNATLLLTTDPLLYTEDGGLGGSGVLDIARQLKMRIKTLAYAYRISNETVYAQRAYRELQNAAGNTSNPFGTAPDNWNTLHFLDLAEFTAGFAIGYDWLYDYWTPVERTAIMWSILDLGIYWGLQGYTNTSQTFAWWTGGTNTQGNWNCVCNSGLTMGALAILNDDPTGMAKQMLGFTIPNAQKGCAFGPSADGTWSETPNYWYFGTTAHAEMTSSLMTATGSDYGMLKGNPSFSLTGLYHLYVTGMTSLFNYGDHGPNKYSTTANGMMFYGSQYNMPLYTLMQRDRIDAPEPHSMFWYDPSATGAFWADLPLDHYFDNGQDQWASMRSSWTDNTGTYIAIKAGNHTGHQTHGDLDAGDFVIDAMGDRWAGELGSGQYLSTEYFKTEIQEADRWLYYRTRTEGQNTIVVNNQNQLVSQLPTCKYDSSNTTQPGGTTVFSVPDGSTAFFTADLTTTYGGTSIVRGMRFINARKQILLQDDITSAATTSQWRMHTNATVDTSAGTSAILTMQSSGNKMSVELLNPPAGVTFTTGPATRNSSDPPVPTGDTDTQTALNQDQPNDGVKVLIINIPTGTSSIQVLFNPSWKGMSDSDFKTPPAVPVTKWTLTSHDN